MPLSFLLSFPQYRNRKPCANSSQQERERRRRRNQSLMFAKREDAIAVPGSERDGVGSPSALLLLGRNTPQHNRTIASARTQFLSSHRARARSTMSSAKVRCLYVWLSEANCAREDSNERGSKNKCCEVFQAILGQYETLIGMNRRRFLRVKNTSMLFVVWTMMMAQPDKRSTVAMPRLKCNDCVTTSSTI